MLFKLPPLSLNQIEKFLVAYFFQNCEKVSPIQNPDPMSKEKVGRKPEPLGNENGRIPRGRLKGGWSGLKLTDTLCY